MQCLCTCAAHRSHQTLLEKVQVNINYKKDVTVLNAFIIHYVNDILRKMQNMVIWQCVKNNSLLINIL